MIDCAVLEHGHTPDSKIQFDVDSVNLNNDDDVFHAQMEQQWRTAGLPGYNDGIDIFEQRMILSLPRPVSVPMRTHAEVDAFVRRRRLELHADELNAQLASTGLADNDRQWLAQFLCISHNDDDTVFHQTFARWGNFMYALWDASDRFYKARNAN